MNIFDGLVYLAAAIAIVAGLRSGFLRSLATLFGYIAAAPATVALAPHLPVVPLGTFQNQNFLVFAIAFIVIGAVLGALLRLALNEVIGPDVSIPDRVIGAVFGAVRVALIAIVIVLIFDRIIPANRQPPWLTESRLRPYLSAAGQAGLKSLPPDLVSQIDRLKRERGI